jgi:hypothetical protein
MARRSTDAGFVSIAPRKNSGRRERVVVEDRGLAVAPIAARAVAIEAGPPAQRRRPRAIDLEIAVAIEVAAPEMGLRPATSGTTGAAAVETAVAAAKTVASGVVGVAVGELGAVARVRRAVASTTSTTSTDPRSVTPDGLVS